MIQKIVLTITLLTLTHYASAHAQQLNSELPILVIGASYANGSTPFNNLTAPLGGTHVGLGSFLSLGNALVKNNKLPGFIVNEAQAGSTTFSRVWCPPGSPVCTSNTWESYSTMFNKALARVAIPPSFTVYNAKYVVVSIPNDCLHSDAFGVPQGSTTPCTVAQLKEVGDRLVSVGQEIVNKGMTPIFDIYPKYENLDMNLFKTLAGLSWVIDETSYKKLRSIVRSKLMNNLPQAIILNIWKDFTHLGDGLHPDYATTRKAANKIANKIISLN